MIPSSIYFKLDHPHFNVFKFNTNAILLNYLIKTFCFVVCSPEVWNKVRSVIRIKVANYTMIMILLGCMGMVISGKRARDRGESLVQRNLDWHKKYSEGKEEVKNLNVFGK